MNDTTHPTLVRLDDQIDWYDRKSQTAQKWFKGLKMIQIVCAGVVPLVTIFGVADDVLGRVTGVLGLAILIVEGLQQLNQYQNNWISYRSTCESLRHEKYLYLGKAGPYAGVADPIPLLADRIEGSISQEHAKWVSVQEQAPKEPATGRPQAEANKPAGG
jgi:Protein of unknown function (DUF4231)